MQEAQAIDHCHKHPDELKKKGYYTDCTDPWFQLNDLQGLGSLVADLTCSK
ncbi:hypothetical protein ACFL0V_06605 [Nanoarchaeota archaeon]